ncbi:hypothetical protein AAZX31_08G100700 [Glycine max]|uniref:Uncharacterized protein n=1 Tax=Glycine max TaxID=3847 RepID=A0A0R0INM3_SOYBN|nr:hypothetical protein GYH30_020831 [Glycine max]KRH42658.1 hypothetical protein GLYMA_08G103500v4 [Glycine max]
MAYSDTWAMCEGKYNSGSLKYKLQKASKRDYCRTITSVMEFESDWIKHRKSSSYTAHVIRSATSFMPWSCRIPIGDGYHEFL